MWENLIKVDKEILIFLNNLGTPTWDNFWLGVTNQFNWTPLFLLILFLTFKFLGWKKGLIVFVLMILLVAFSDQFTNLIKNSVMRLRPNNDPSLKNQLRTLVSPRGYSFYSGHATTSTAFITFVYLILKKRVKFLFVLFFFPLIFAYSRLYLGVHFPLDIFSGFIAGTLTGFLFYKIFNLLDNRFLNTLSNN